MKKSIALLALAFGVTGAYAQDLTSKKGEPILPEADDWAISVDATPFLNYMGNFFGKTNNNTAPSWNFLTNNLTITGKMFKDAQTAYRASVRIGYGTTSNTWMNSDRSVTTPAVYPNADAMKENKYKTSNTNIGLAVGMEKRKGKTRLQGFYGAELGIGLGSSSEKFEYGNALSASGTIVTVNAADEYNATVNNVQTVPALNATGDARLLERKSGMNFDIGVRGFIGAEYFVLPKMSIGGEFGWGLGFTMNGQNTEKWESIGNNGTADQTATTEIKGAKSNGFTIDSENKNSIFGPYGPSAALKLTLHF